MAYSKSELLEFVQGLPDDAQVAFLSEMAGEEVDFDSDQMLINLGELEEEELLDLDLCMKDEEATHIFYVA